MVEARRIEFFIDGNFVFKTIRKQFYKTDWEKLGKFYKLLKKTIAYETSDDSYIAGCFYWANKVDEFFVSIFPIGQNFEGWRHSIETVNELKLLLGSILRGVQQMHQKLSYVHGDIRLPNVIKRRNKSQFILIDFEYATLLNQETIKYDFEALKTENLLFDNSKPHLIFDDQMKDFIRKYDENLINNFNGNSINFKNLLKTLGI